MKGSVWLSAAFLSLTLSASLWAQEPTVIQQRIELEGEDCFTVGLAGGAVTRGANGTYTATVTGASGTPTYKWKFTGGGQTIQKDTGESNTWGGKMVVGGTLEVTAKVDGKECTTTLAVVVNSRGWNANVQAPNVNRAWGAAPTYEGDFGNATPTQTPIWNLVAGNIAVAKIADDGPNHGFTYVTSAPVVHGMNININTHLNNAASAFSLAQGNADDVQRIIVGNGEPDETAISAGTNGVIDSPPDPDDQTVGQTVTTGTNGICNTDKKVGSDDVQEIDRNNGESNSIIITPGGTGRLNIAANSASDDQVAGVNVNSGLDGVANTAINNAAEQTQAAILLAVERHEGEPANPAEDSHWENWLDIEAADTDMNGEAEDEIGFGTVAALQAQVAGLLNTIAARLVTTWNASGEPPGYLPGGTVFDFAYPDPSFPAY